MNTGKRRIGVWMDHQKARVVSYSSGEMKVEDLDGEKEELSDKDTALTYDQRQNREQHQHRQFYRRLREYLMAYEDILLLGPGTAKNEFRNYVKEQGGNLPHIHLEGAAAFTDRQLVAFVEDYFSRHDLNRAHL